MTRNMLWYRLFAVVLVLSVVFSASFVNVNTNWEAKGLFTVGTVEAAGTADATADGTNDNVQVQALLDALPTAGGRIYILTGTYVWANGVSVTRAINNVTISGTGAGTYLTGDGVTSPFTAGGNNWVFQDLRVSVTTAVLEAAMGTKTGWEWRNITTSDGYFAFKTDDATTGASWSIPTGRGSTCYVAANDASTLEKAQADYVCDGTADDVQIQAALNAALADGGGVVVLSSGNFNSSTIVVIGDNTELRGCGIGITTFTKTGNTDAMIISDELEASGYAGVENATIRDISFDADYTGLTDVGNILTFAHATNIKVIGCEFLDWAQNYHAIELNSTSNGLVTQCVFNSTSESSTGTGAVQIQAAVTDALGTAPTESGQTYNDDNTQPQYVTVCNNHFTLDSSWAVENHTEVAGTNASYIEVYGNYVVGGGLTSLNDTDHLIVRDNIVLNPFANIDGVVRVQATANTITDTRILNNIMIFNNTGIGVRGGISTGVINGLVISGNWISGLTGCTSAHAGIVIVTSSTGDLKDIIIENNHIELAGSTGGMLIGVYTANAGSTMDRVYVRGNHLIGSGTLNNPTGGIRLEASNSSSSSELHADNNTIDMSAVTSTTDAIKILGKSGARVSRASANGNHIYDAGQNAIYFYEVDYYQVSGNLIYRFAVNAASGGIYAVLADNGLIADNILDTKVTTGATNNAAITLGHPSYGDANYVTVTGNKISNTEQAIRTRNTSDSNIITNNDVSDTNTATISYVGSNNTVRGNKGYIDSGEIRTVVGSLTAPVATATTVTGTFTESPATIKPGANTLHCTADGTLSVVIPTGSIATVASVGGGATVTGSPVALTAGTTVVTVTAGGTNEFTVTLTAIVFRWHNVEAQDCYVRKVAVDITTAGGTATAVIDVGIADDATGTNIGTEFFDDIDGNSADLNDSWVSGDGGQQTKWVLLQDSASATDGWIVGQILTEAASSLAGRYYIEYVGR